MPQVRHGVAIVLQRGAARRARLWQIAQPL